MKIALDYDDTYTKDPELWDSFIAEAKERMHEVTFVTLRFSKDVFMSRYNHKENDLIDHGWYLYNEDILSDAENLEIPVIFTGGAPKSQHYKADIWIDDSPEFING